MAHEFPLRVYYEDTDFGGVVYYANYLKFIERGRSEWLRALGLDQKALKSDLGLVFAVRRVLADYLRPAVFDDALVVRTQLAGIGGARLDLLQEVSRGETLLFTAEVTLVCMSLEGKALRLPEALRAVFA
jgi:acyl-CoA thioester hydrolase